MTRPIWLWGLAGVIGAAVMTVSAFLGAPFEGGAPDPKPPVAGDPAEPETPVAGDPAEPEPPVAGDPTEPEPPVAGDPAEPETPVAGDPTEPEPPVAGDPTAPETPVAGDPTEPEPPVAGDPTEPEPPVAGDPTEPETPVAGDPTEPETPVAGDPAEPEPPVAGDPTAPVTPVAGDPTPPDPDPAPEPNPFAGNYLGPGELLPRSGTGYQNDKIFVPGMRFPMERTPAYANSQVWGVGGFRGPPGGQCDRRNYSYPWRDNFCETRGYSTSFCPTGKGHQGQDIRPATCKKDVHWAVAVESGTITHFGTYTVTLVGNSGREYRYMHLNMRRLAVRKGQRVDRGERIGLVSNFFGGTPTTIHLHFEIREVQRDANGRLRKRQIPPYTSLVDAYRRMLISGL